MFEIRTLRQSIERAAQEAIECGNAKTRELAAQLLKEVRKTRFGDATGGLYLADGRLFVRRDSGVINEADQSQRGYALLLVVHDSGTLDPARGLELFPPSDN
jgi:hypothetical protein